MDVRYRPMRPGDIRECVQIVAADPNVAARYGNLMAHLRPAWLRLLGCAAFRAVVFEDLGGMRPRLVGVGVSAFVSERFARAVQTPPFSWAGPEAIREIVRGGSPLLSDAQLREANTSTGLTLFCWHGSTRREDRYRLEVQNPVLTAFVEVHRGYFLKEMFFQAENAQHVEMVVNTGGLVLSPTGCGYLDFMDQKAQEVIVNPHVFGLTRELAAGQIGSWVASLFIYQPPRFGFRPSEQRLLLAAHGGGTDEELSDELKISLSAVKKTWRAIYDRIAERRPDLVPGAPLRAPWARERGKEKKQRLIAYLREHPEELRPVSRKLLPRHVARWDGGVGPAAQRAI